jgi:uncharacterized membrane protein
MIDMHRGGDIGSDRAKQVEEGVDEACAWRRGVERSTSDSQVAKNSKEEEDKVKKKNLLKKKKKKRGGRREEQYPSLLQGHLHPKPDLV